MKTTLFFLSALAVSLGGCAVGPDYHQPLAFVTQPMPEAFSGAATSQWQPVAPAASLPRGAWWGIFGEAELNRLEMQANSQNQGLAAAYARVQEARDLVGITRAGLFPQLALQTDVTRQRTSANEPFIGKPAGAAYTYDTFSLPLDLSWELDLWGRVRRETEAARARWVATTDDLESARLALQAEVAADYFTLRALDAERRIVADTIDTYRHSLALTQDRRRGGVASDLDVSQAETQLRATEAQLPALELQRANSLHALANLTGQPATGFQIPVAASATNVVPSVPASVPAELLERRPDIAAAERRMAAANADIGVAVSAFYPHIVLNGLAGFQSIDAGTWLDWPSRMWAVGPSLSLPIFTGGRNRAQLASARDAYAEAIANYRQTVLAAFQEVEDALAAQQLLSAQLSSQTAALTAARRTLQIADNRYRAGLVSYLEVTTAQSVALDNERTVVQLQGQRLVVVTSLIKALGGGWSPPPDLSLSRR